MLRNPRGKTRYKRYEYAEDILDISLFEKDKLTFAVLAGIVNNGSRLVITDHKSFVICHSVSPYPVWIWAEDDITEAKLKDIWDCAEKEFPADKGYRFNTKYFIADYFIKRSREEGEIPFEISLNMCAYECREPVAPSTRPDGRAGIAAGDDLSDASAFIRQFKQDTGVDIEPEEECFKKAKSLIEEGKLYFWKDGTGKNVAMCSFSADETMGRITHVFTKQEERRKGYAASLVYEITCIMRNKGLLPVLYTDADYEASNECYKKIGYMEKGRLCTMSVCWTDDR